MQPFIHLAADQTYVKRKTTDLVIRWIQRWTASSNWPVCPQRKQEAQLMLTNPRDAFRGQSRSPNIVPFHMLGIVSSCLCNKTRRFHDIRLQKMSWPWNPCQRSLKVTESGTIR